MNTLYASCDCCKKEFPLPRKNYFNRLKKKRLYGKRIFCSPECRREALGQIQFIKIPCKNCLKEVVRSFGNIKRYRNTFCSIRCSSSYNNRIKKYGTQRSKLEKWIEKRMPEYYPNLLVHYCQKDAIGSELDIYVPELKLAIEINGIFHYKPIFGQETLEKIQRNDSKKKEACDELGITFQTIDVSTFFSTPFKEIEAQQYLDIVLNYIQEQLNLIRNAPVF